MKMRFDLRFLALLTLIGLLLAACSLGKSRETSSGSSPISDTTTGGGPCKNVDICTLIPQSQVNTTLGLTAMFTSPETPINMGGMTSDQCNYSVGASAPGIHAEFLRQCHPDKFTPLTYDDVRKSYLAPGGTREDLSGVGEKAFYETVPGQSGTTLPPKVRLVAFKGNIYVVLSDSYAPAAQDAKVKQGLTSFANTLLNAK